jgi:hypothetical protein
MATNLEENGLREVVAYYRRGNMLASESRNRAIHFDRFEELLADFGRMCAEEAADQLGFGGVGEEFWEIIASRLQSRMEGRKG